MPEIIFVGGVGGKKWLENGKNLSRNYRQGNRVYDSDGIASTLTAQPIGGTGGFTSLYLIDEGNVKNSIKKDVDIQLNKTIKKFTYVELFAGVGGFRSALDRLGGECVFASEFDKFAKKSYAALYGDEHLHGNIKKIDEKDIPEHDLLVGGFPCQSFSVAGKRKGFDDTRGTLFFDVVRIAKEKQPKVVLLENVKGLVGHDKGNTLDVMIQTLCEANYVVDFDVLNSKFFGVPQNRERIFIVAIREDLIEQEDWVISGSTVVPKGKRRIQDLEGVKTFNFAFPKDDGKSVKKLKDVLEDEVDEKYYLDEEKTSKIVARLEDRGLTEGVIEYHPFSKKNDVIRPHRIDEKKSGISELDTDSENNLSSTVVTTHMSKDYEERTSYRIRKLTPKECWRLQGFPDESFDKVKEAGLSDSQLYKQSGNAVTVNVVEEIGRELLKYI